MKIWNKMSIWMSTASRTSTFVWEARSDYLVWKVGIDKAYTAFIAEKPQLPSSILTAVLLTIL